MCAVATSPKIHGSFHCVTLVQAVNTPGCCSGGADCTGPPHAYTALSSAVAASQEGLRLQQSPAEIWTTPGQTAELNCTTLHQESFIYWYKERQDGSLQWVARSGKYVEAKGRYSSKVSSTGKTHSLVISQLQEEDSGLYYCGLEVAIHSSFGNGTRLIVSGEFPTSQKLSVPFWTTLPQHQLQAGTELRASRGQAVPRAGGCTIRPGL